MNNNHRATRKIETIQDLGDLVAEGFGEAYEHIASLAGRMDKLGNRMENLKNHVTHYLELSDKRYIELKQKNDLLAQWVKILADKLGVPVDISQLKQYE